MQFLLKWWARIDPAPITLFFSFCLFVFWVWLLTETISYCSLRSVVLVFCGKQNSQFFLFEVQALRNGFLSSLRWYSLTQKKKKKITQCRQRLKTKNRALPTTHAKTEMPIMLHPRAFSLPFFLFRSLEGFRFPRKWKSDRPRKRVRSGAAKSKAPFSSNFPGNCVGSRAWAKPAKECIGTNGIVLATSSKKMWATRAVAFLFIPMCMLTSIVLLLLLVPAIKICSPSSFSKCLLAFFSESCSCSRVHTGAIRANIQSRFHAPAHCWAAFSQTWRE